MTEPHTTRDGDVDPRIRDEYVEPFRDDPASGDGRGDLVLVGVVHDHPASKYRVRRVVECESPDVLALELPPLAVPLYEQYATDSRTPPVFGGEMSAAIQAAGTDRTEGIDGPTPSFLFLLAQLLARERASVGTVKDTLKSAVSIARDTVRYRIGAALGGLTALRVEADEPTEYESGWNDPPERQASDERTQIQKANAMMTAFETSQTADICTEARERHMATRLAALRESGDVVAVVGMGHLDALRSHLSDDA